jgi:uncharacterized DUF497 family protein
MLFTWDPAKEAENKRKHRISFRLARRVFFDPLHLILFDRVVDGEERWHAIGHAPGSTLLVVVHTLLDEREQVIRIISARRATSYEQGEYKDGYR